MEKSCKRCGEVFGCRACVYDKRVYCSRTCQARETKEEAIARFWSNVNKTKGCWEWKRKCKVGVYPAFSATSLGIKTNEKVHRVQFLMTHGFMPQRPSVVMHKCDNTICVRPDHLVLGTDRENIKDMDSKGRRRAAKGNKIGSSKLTSADVISIRKYRGGGETLKAIGRRYGVSHNAISAICTGKTWSWLKPVEAEYGIKVVII